MVDPDAAPGTVWILKRSTDLVTFDEIFRYDGVSESFDMGDVVPTLDPAVNPTSITIFDFTPPTPTAIYRFEAELAP